MFEPRSVRLAERVQEMCRARGLTVATVESVTGGLVAGCLTAVPGASQILAGGWVVYTEEAKRELVGLDAESLEEHGPVSPETSQALAEAGRELLGTELALATTGYASSGPGVPADQVGEVHIALAGEEKGPVTDTIVVPGSRDQVRSQAVAAAVALLVRRLEA